MANVAISLGVGLASQFLIGLLTQTQVQKSEGARLDDLGTPKAEFGATLPKPYGTVRLNGCNIFWSPDNHEEIIVKKKRQGKGLGGGVVQQNTTYNYYGNFGASVCDATQFDADGVMHSGIWKVNRIWLNGDLYYNDGKDVTPKNRTADQKTEKQKELMLSKHLEIYIGSATQNPSPTIESFEGVAPAFRHICYLVFRDLPLERFSNRPPKVDVEVITQSFDPLLYQIVDDLCARSGLLPSQWDSVELDHTIKGVIFKQDGGTPRQFLENLQKLYLFQARERNGKVEFIKTIRTNTTATLTIADLATHESESEVPPLYEETRVSNLELPSEIQLEYKNINNNHDRGLQYARKRSTTHDNVMSLNPDITLDDSSALTIVNRLIEYLWLQRRKFEGVKLLPQWLGLAAGDVISIPVRGQALKIQITSLDIGANLQLDIGAIVYDAEYDNIDLDSPTNEEYDDDFYLPYYGDPEVHVFDTNLVSDSDEDFGVYVGVRSDWDFKQGVIYAKETGGDYQEVDAIAGEMVYGTVSGTLPYAPSTVVDRTTVFTVVLEDGELDPLTDVQFYNLEQLALIGNELICIQNATLTAPKTYQCSNLIRGCRGTEWAINNHISGESFVLLKGEGTINQITASPNTIGKTLTFKCVPYGRSVDSVEEETSKTIVGNTLKPYAPCNPKLSKNLTTGDLTLVWSRRTRRYGAWRDLIETVPLEEEFEAYQLDIRNGSTVLRSIALTSPTYIYTSALQVTDFGSNPSNLDITIYQKSAVIGLGYPLAVENLEITEVV